MVTKILWSIREVLDRKDWNRWSLGRGGETTFIFLIFFYKKIPASVVLCSSNGQFLISLFDDNNLVDTCR
jgi:hypothetical protein